MSSDLPVVLLVDDEVRSLDAMRRTLDEDFQILTAESAEAARDVLAEREVAVILCDQRMPGLTGVEAGNRLVEAFDDAGRQGYFPQEADEPGNQGERLVPTPAIKQREDGLGGIDQKLQVGNVLGRFDEHLH